ncbi:MAG: SpoIIE family protein phosphatase [Lachnospiraceae bacterium]|nr:SpoIIE family protein phosphatase [Lachnospiraceae bacterium]
MIFKDKLKGFGFAVVAFLVGNAFVYGINPFIIGCFAAICLAGENAWLSFAAATAGLFVGGSVYEALRYGISMLVVWIILGFRDSINIRGKNILSALIVSGIVAIAEFTSGLIPGSDMDYFNIGVMSVMTFAATVVFLKGIQGIKDDPLCIVTDNETAFGVLALFSALLYGVPLSVGSIIVAQSFFVFMILFTWYKFGFGIGLVWTVISSAIMGVKAGSTAYLSAFLVIVLSAYALQIFIDGGRLMQVAVFLLVYYAVGFVRYDMLLSDDGIKALYSALLVFMLAPSKLLLRVDERAGYYDPENSPEWGRLVVNRVNTLADAFKRIEYTFAGEAGSGIGFNDVGGIIENFTNRLNEAVPMKKTIEAAIVEELSAKEVLVKNILLIKNRDERYEVYINARVRRGRLVAADTVRKIVEDKMKVKLMLKDESRSIVSRNYDMICLIEKPDFKCKTAVRRLSRYEDEISGDNFYIGDIPNGQKLLLIADGMGNGEKASNDSIRLIDTLEELLNAGFDKDISIKIVNSFLAEKNKGERFSTLDMLIVDLYTGYGRIYKQGAATTFVKRGEWIEYIKSTSLPVGITPDAACEKCMKKFYSDDMIVMVSDGLLESIIFENKEDYMKELMLNNKAFEPDEMADEIIENVKSLSGNRLKDDATVIVCKIVKSL